MSGVFIFFKLLVSKLLKYNIIYIKGVDYMLTGEKIRNIQIEESLVAELKWLINKAVDEGDLIFEHLDPLFDLLYKVQEG